MSGWNYRSHDTEDVIRWLNKFENYPDKAIYGMIQKAEADNVANVIKSPLGHQRIVLGIVSYAIYEDKPISREFLLMGLEIAKDLSQDDRYLKRWSNVNERKAALIKEIYLIQWELSDNESPTHSL